MELKKMKRALFLDRDGILVEDDQIDTFEKIIWIRHVFEGLRTIRRNTDYEFVLVSNQDGVGSPSFPFSDYRPVHERIMSTLSGEDISFDEEYIDFTLPSDNCPGRKPGIAMLSEYQKGDYDLVHSFMVGDRLTDVKLARNLGCRSIWFVPKEKAGELGELAAVCDLVSDDWLAVAAFLTGDRSAVHRTAQLERKTRETEVSLSLDLDGTGQGHIETGIGFFDHMLAQIVKHSACDIHAHVKGDLYVDEHHSVEDLALSLGQAFLSALGDKRGINRYGFDLLMMDDVFAEVAIDFSARPDFIWQVNFTRESVGQFPTELFRHFFKSFSDEAKCNLMIRVSDGNAHHQAEAIFKAFARAVKEAVHRNPGSNELPSTKGVL